MLRIALSIWLIGIVECCSGQLITNTELHGIWFLQQQLLDSMVVFDANNEAGFPKPSADEIERMQALAPIPIDTAVLYASIHQNFENLRHYQLQFDADSTYQTIFTAGMSRPLPAPEKGRFELRAARAELELFLPDSYSTTSTVRISSDTLYLTFDGPFVTRLVFRRQAP